jgi:hypothetical protein
MSRKQEMELVRKVGLFGLKDLNKLAPIGDLGYMNGWYPSSLYETHWANTELPNAIYRAYCEQKKYNNWTEKSWSTGYRQTDHHTYCPELGLKWSVDSGD